MSHLVSEDNMYSTQDYIDEFERILIKGERFTFWIPLLFVSVDSDEDFIVTEEDATVTKCVFNSSVSYSVFQQQEWQYAYNFS